MIINVVKKNSKMEYGLEGESVQFTYWWHWEGFYFSVLFFSLLLLYRIEKLNQKDKWKAKHAAVKYLMNKLKMNEFGHSKEYRLFWRKLKEVTLIFFLCWKRAIINIDRIKLEKNNYQSKILFREEIYISSTMAMGTENKIENQEPQGRHRV